MQCKDNDLKATASFLIALCTEESEIEVLTTLQQVFANLVHMLESALQNVDRREEGGFS